jgi:hypothetical protein
MYAMSREQLQAAYDRAMEKGCFAAAERIAFELDEPRTTYVPPVREEAVAA